MEIRVTKAAKEMIAAQVQDGKGIRIYVSGIG